MYIDLIILAVLIVIIMMFFKRFSSFVFLIAIIEMFLNILTFIKCNISLKDVVAILNKYFPGSLLDIIDKYTGKWELVNIILRWSYLILMIIFLTYVIKIFLKRKKIY